MGIFRLFLASVVMLSHYGVLELSLASIAVCCFYIISGFYMQLLLSSPGVSTVNFYISRAFRIYPLYWVLTAVTLLAQAPSELWHFADHLGLKLLYVLNTIAIFGHDALALVQYDPESGHFSSLLSLDTPAKGNWIGYNLSVVGQAWSLSVELLFYAMAPFLLKLRTRWLCLILFLSACIKMRIISFGVYNTFWIDAFYPAELTFFLSGALAFRFYERLPSISRLPSPFQQFFGGCPILILIAAVAVEGSNSSLITQHWFTIYLAVTAITALSLPFLFRATRYNGIDRWLGNLSYPMYLSHLAVVQVLRDVMHIDNLASIVVATFAVSIGAYSLIEKPVDEFRHAKFPVSRARKTDAPGRPHKGAALRPWR